MFRLNLGAGILLLGGTLSHHIGGGSFVDSSSMVKFLGIIYLGVLLTSNNKLEGPKLALLVTITQSASHFILGGASHSNLKMLFSHVLGGAISYWIFLHAERAIQLLLKSARRLLNVFLPTLEIDLVKFSNGKFESSAIFDRSLHCKEIQRRGPPLKESLLA